MPPASSGPKAPPMPPPMVIKANIPRSTENIRWYYPESFGDNAVRVRQVDEENERWYWSDWQWLRNDKTSQPFSLKEVFTQQSIWKVIAAYITAGYEHILPKGLDHILFILGIFFLSTKFKPLLWQVTMFTIAHTITLGLSMSGLINAPASIVEPLIALSITYVALENLMSSTLHKSRLIIVFIFGLLHGLGFASMLKDFGMPDHAFFTALISFNIGVELGQLSIILMAFFLIAYWFKNKHWYQGGVVIPISLIISLIGLYWTIDRFDFGAINEVFA